MQTVSENAVFPHLIYRKFSFTTWPFNGIPKYTFMAFTDIYKATLPATCVVLKSAAKSALSREKTSCNGNLVLVSEKKKKKKKKERKKQRKKQRNKERKKERKKEKKKERKIER